MFGKVSFVMKVADMRQLVASYAFVAPALSFALRVEDDPVKALQEIYQLERALMKLSISAISINEL